MKRNFWVVLVMFLAVLGANPFRGQAQSFSGAKKILADVDSLNGVYDISGDGRFVLFTSQSNLSTVGGTRNNSDGNDEIFLFDYAQRHIFQITNTKDLVNASGTTLMHMHNANPRISNDGKYIVFSSRATTSTPSVPNNTNPGNFDANNYQNELLTNGNLEIWLYELPSYSSVNLSEGVEPAFVDLTAGTFRQITNTNPYFAGSDFYQDNDLPVINDDGCVVAFQSFLDIVGNNNDNTDEIYTWVNDRPSCQNIPSPPINIKQVTQIPFISALSPLRVNFPALSGDGRKLAFWSTANNPINGMSGSSNNDFNGEVFLTDLGPDGGANGVQQQVTHTTAPNPLTVINTFSRYGKRMSRDGRYLAFDSRWQLDQPTTGSLQNSSAVFIYDSVTSQFQQVGPRWDSDSALATSNPDVNHFPVFTDYDSNKSPGTLLFTSRVNINSSGAIPGNPNDGLNSNSIRQAQIYSYSLGSTSGGFSRRTIPSTTDFVPCRITGNANVGYSAGCDRDPLVGNSSIRMVYPQDLNSSQNFNRDFIYLNNPTVSYVVPIENYSLSYLTGASEISLTGEGQLAAGLAPNMLATVRLPTVNMTPEPASTVPTGVSNSRRFAAPIQLRGASVSVDGYAAQLVGIRKGEINFIVPTEVGIGVKPFNVNYQGKLFQGTLNIVQTQPDVLRTQSCPCSTPGRTRIFNITEPNNPLPEPFSVLTQTANGTQPTRLRAYVTGIKGASSGSIGLQIGSTSVPSILSAPQESDFPGVYTVDFILPSSLAGAGDVPLIVSNIIGGQSAQSRSAATAANFQIAANQIAPTDLAIWRTSNGAWYVSNGQGGFQAALQWGLSNDIPAPGDYDGDGKTDFCVFRPSNGAWYMVKSSDGSVVITTLGLSGDKPAAADYDGDGKTDYAVYRESNTSWYIYSSLTGQQSAQNLGVSGVDKVIPADYDADGKADFAFWIKKDAKFLIWNNSQSSLAQTTFGQSDDRPVIGDYDGDGKADIATWRESDGNWRILNSSNNQISTVAWGDPGTDIAVPGDYDADGKTDIAVWRSSGTYAGYWFISKSSNGQARIELWGMAGDIPVPAPYHR